MRRVGGDHPPAVTAESRQKKSRVFVKQRVVGEEVHVFVSKRGRENKDRAIREKHEARLLSDLVKLQARVIRVACVTRGRSTKPSDDCGRGTRASEGTTSSPTIRARALWPGGRIR